MPGSRSPSRAERARKARVDGKQPKDVITHLGPHTGNLAQRRETHAVGVCVVHDNEGPMGDDVRPPDRGTTRSGAVPRPEFRRDQVVGVDAVFVRLTDAVLRPVLEAFGAAAPPPACSAIDSMILSAVASPSTQ